MTRSIMAVLAAAALSLVGALVDRTAGLGAGSGSEVVASPWVTLHQASRARLVAAPGGKVNAGVEVELEEGWKTYWRMPGDAGVPPQFEWQTSENVRDVKVLYPAPQRIAEPAAETIGYKHSVVFPIEAVASDAGKPMALRLELELGVCREICVPAQAAFSVTIPPGGSRAALPDVLAQALAKVPVPQADAKGAYPTLVKADADLAGSSPKLTVEARFPGNGQDADLFIEAPDSIYVPMAKKLAPSANGIVRFEAGLSAGTARDLKGKELTLTLVSAAGSAEARWKLP